MLIKNDFKILPTFKNCQYCGHILLFTLNINSELFFFCKDCSKSTKWNYNSILAKSNISSNEIEKLLELYIKGYSKADTIKTLALNFVQLKLNKNTVSHYYEIFDDITMSLYNKEINTILLEGSIELDETYISKPKNSFAPHRPLVIQNLWLFGMFTRETGEFIVYPVL